MAAMLVAVTHTMTKIQNDYLEAFLAKPSARSYLDYSVRDFEGRPRYIDIRKEMVHKYSWAVPALPALEALHALGPLVEIGAGLGYWAFLLRQLGADILAYDEEPDPLKNTYTSEEAARIKIVPWTEVLKGGPEKAWEHRNRALFLCWPPYDDPMAYRCLVQYGGQRIALIGEGRGGCTADDKFFRRLHAGWEQTDEIDIPQWDGIHDYLSIYRRDPGYFAGKRGKLSKSRRRRLRRRRRAWMWCD